MMHSQLRIRFRSGLTSSIGGMMRLRDKDLDFARKHIEYHSSSDFFPDVNEFSALWAMWDEVKKQLLARDVQSMGEPPLQMAAPKANGGYRIVHQLNPLDALTYTAL